MESSWFCLLFGLASLAAVATAQSDCTDLYPSCLRYKNSGYCSPNSGYYSFMKRECKKSCGFCSTTTTTGCRDVISSCQIYRQHCPVGSYYHDYMKKNCKATCNFCGPASTVAPKTSSPVTSKPGGPPEYPCSFEGSLCEWVNERFDDTADWETGVDSNGPQQAVEGSSYLYMRGTGKAVLKLPWLVVLPAGIANKGDMCMKFKYSMSSGLLKVTSLPIRTASDKRPTPNLLFSTRSASSGWKQESVLMSVSTRASLEIEGSQTDMNGYIALDDLAFHPGAC